MPNFVFAYHGGKKPDTPEEGAAMWELASATSLPYAGADLLILYHPEAAMATRRAIDRLMDGMG